ncbi:sensor histidine kinase [Comamonas sp. 4034]|uniref:sensor histidine kinase n=1 Tax=Comamonas sp. 4034 TaxID=3156455 RepID=UPI003D1F8A11
MNLNFATIAVLCAMVEFALFIGILALRIKAQAQYLIYWGSGFLAFGVGSILVALREMIPDFFTILIADLSATLSSILLHVGICLFFNRQWFWLPWMLVILACEAFGLSYYTYFTYDTSARMYVYSCAQILLTCMTLQMLLVMTKKQRRYVPPEIIAVLLMLLACYCARIVGTSFFPVEQNFLASGNFQTILTFGLMLIHINYALVFGNMHASALNAELSSALSVAKAKERQKVEILGYISHDLRAPLATISGYSKLLLTDAPQEQRKLLQTIERSVKYQLNLIDELLEYAQSELSPLTIKPVNTNLHRLLDDISKYAIALCSFQDNRYRFTFSERLPLHIDIDRKRLQQVLLNLLSNAAKFTRDGTVTLSITAKPEGNAFTILHFAVSDTGIGMDLKQGVDIFEAFQQVQAASGSNGLGLFIAQRIVAAMGGTLGVISTPYQGTTFSFELRIPVIDAFVADWPIIVLSESGLTKRESMAPPLESAMPSHALDELAKLALHGRFSDIEVWIELHATENSYTLFLDRVRSLLAHLDFPAIHMMALRNSVNSRKDPCLHVAERNPAACLDHLRLD